MIFIVKQNTRYPLYRVEAWGFKIDDGHAIFWDEQGCEVAAITNVDYVVPEDQTDTDVSVNTDWEA